MGFGSVSITLVVLSSTKNYPYENIRFGLKEEAKKSELCLELCEYRDSFHFRNAQLTPKAIEALKEGGVFYIPYAAGIAPSRWGFVVEELGALAKAMMDAGVWTLIPKMGDLPCNNNSIMVLADIVKLVRGYFALGTLWNTSSIHGASMAGPEDPSYPDAGYMRMAMTYLDPRLFKEIEKHVTIDKSVRRTRKVVEEGGSICWAI